MEMAGIENTAAYHEKEKSRPGESSRPAFCTNSPGRAPAKVDGVKYVDGEKTMFYITIHEGRNRQVRRMVSSVGHDVLRLRRVQVGPIRLGTLKKGEWRYLTESEIEQLYSCL